MGIQTISVQEVARIQANGEAGDFVDVRTPGEYESVHAVGTRNVPLDRLDARAFLAARNGMTGKPIYVICKGGTRSAQAAQKFVEAGFADVYSVSGGTSAWEQAGLPVNRGERRVLPLDRQIQSVAGLICLIGVTLGTFVNPWFYLLAGFVGAGLFMAGLTGFCPMGILMAKMPWNQGKACGTCCTR